MHGSARWIPLRAALAAVLFLAASGARAQDRAPIPQGVCTGNLALDGPTTASGHWAENVPGAAVDGVPSTGWGSDSSSGAWLQVDLGAVQTIGAIVLNWGWDHRFGNSALSVVEGSTDGVTFTPLMHTRLYAKSCHTTCWHPRTYKLTPAPARYVRFRAVQWNGGWGAVNALEIYGACQQTS